MCSKLQILANTSKTKQPIQLLAKGECVSQISCFKNPPQVKPLPSENLDPPLWGQTIYGHFYTTKTCPLYRRQWELVARLLRVIIRVTSTISIQINYTYCLYPHTNIQFNDSWLLEQQLASNTILVYSADKYSEIITLQLYCNDENTEYQ